MPLFGVIQQYQAAQAPNITSNLQRTLLGNHNIPVLGVALKLIRRNSKIEFELDRLRELKDRVQARD